MTFDPYAQVQEFHRAFKAWEEPYPHFPPDGTVTAMRVNLIGEECLELVNAIEDKDLVETADALADLLYVVYGAAIAFGIDIRPVFDEVHRSNMAKVGGPTRADGKILKPEGWKPPDVKGIIEGQISNYMDKPVWPPLQWFSPRKAPGSDTPSSARCDCANCLKYRERHPGEVLASAGVE